MSARYTLTENFKAARRAGTPLVLVNCFDPEATMQEIQASLNGKADETGIVRWDVIRGWMHRNPAGEAAITEALGGASIQETENPVASLEFAAKLPPQSILFVMNAQHYLKGDKARPDFIQALWNLRDQFKHNKRTVVLLASGLAMPPELQSDVLVIEEQLPDDCRLGSIVDEIAAVAKCKLSDETRGCAVDALRGLAAFSAEQAVAMSFSKDGLDLGRLWERKRQMINETPGLTVWMGGQRFDDLGGLCEIKERVRRILGGRKPPKVIVWLDEMEKAMGGAAGDTSGTSQDQEAVLLSEMQDRGWDGMMLVGVPGAAKSAFAKAIANEAGILCIRLDLGALKGQFVGQSEERMRTAMKIIQAVGGEGGAFFVATSNDIRAVKPEIKRRLKKGIWFFDSPDEEGQEPIWKIKLAQYKPDNPGKRPPCEGWTGAEIESCVATAWEEGCTLVEAARSIIPVTVSGREQVERLRREAHGRYNSTEYAGAYRMPGEDSILPKRSLDLEP